MDGLDGVGHRAAPRQTKEGRDRDHDDYPNSLESRLKFVFSMKHRAARILVAIRTVSVHRSVRRRTSVKRQALRQPRLRFSIGFFSSTAADREKFAESP
jgi:hypothetical protein